MDDEREQLVEITTAQQVINAEFYNALKRDYPMLAQLMWEKFKNFLNDSYFTDIERQTILMKFFEEQKDLDLIQDIIKFAKECDLKDDYTKIIMEWTYNNSDIIIREALKSVDGLGFFDKKEPTKATLKNIPDSNEFLKMLMDALSNLGVNLDDE